MVQKLGSQKKLDYYFDLTAMNIYNEMRHAKIINLKDLDLFCEQGAICSMLGIVECTKRSRLYEVLAFVDSKGCVSKRSRGRRRRKRMDVLIGRLLFICYS